LYKLARDRALIRRNILARWSTARLFPFNPDRVIRSMPKPPAEISCPNVEVVESPPQEEVVLVILVILVTPVTIQALTSLHD
jgi:hypothetical protein